MRKFELLCLGYDEILGSHRKTFNDTCQVCKPGHFNDDPSQHACRKCRAGVICLEGNIATLSIILSFTTVKCSRNVFKSVYECLFYIFVWI